jgi:hypothetical protein
MRLISLMNLSVFATYPSSRHCAKGMQRLWGSLVPPSLQPAFQPLARFLRFALALDKQRKHIVECAVPHLAGAG